MNNRGKEPSIQYDEFISACEDERAFLQLMRGKPDVVSKLINELRDRHILINSDKSDFDPYQFPAPFLAFSAKKIAELLREDSSERKALLEGGLSQQGTPLTAIPAKMAETVNRQITNLLKELAEAEKAGWPYRKTLNAVIDYTQLLQHVHCYKYTVAHFADLMEHSLKDLLSNTRQDDVDSILKHFDINMSLATFLKQYESESNLLSSSSVMRPQLLLMIGQYRFSEGYDDNVGVDFPMITAAPPYPKSRELIFGETRVYGETSEEEVDMDNESSPLKPHKWFFVPQFSTLEIDFFNQIRPGCVFPLGLLTPSIGYVVANNTNLAAHTFLGHDIFHAFLQSTLSEDELRMLGNREQTDIEVLSRELFEREFNRYFEDWEGDDKEYVKKLVHVILFVAVHEVGLSFSQMVKDISESDIEHHPIISSYEFDYFVKPVMKEFREKDPDHFDEEEISLGKELLEAIIRQIPSLQLAMLKEKQEIRGMNIRKLYNDFCELSQAGVVDELSRFDHPELISLLAFIIRQGDEKSEKLLEKMLVAFDRNFIDFETITVGSSSILHFAAHHTKPNMMVQILNEIHRGDRSTAIINQKDSQGRYPAEVFLKCLEKDTEEGAFAVYRLALTLPLDELSKLEAIAKERHFPLVVDELNRAREVIMKEQANSKASRPLGADSRLFPTSSDGTSNVGSSILDGHRKKY